MGRGLAIILAEPFVKLGDDGPRLETIVRVDNIRKWLWGALQVTEHLSKSGKSNVTDVGRALQRTAVLTTMRRIFAESTFVFNSGNTFKEVRPYKHAIVVCLRWRPTQARSDMVHHTGS